jgi:hypothetical protein
LHRRDYHRAVDVEYELENEPREREMPEFFNAEESCDEDPSDEVRAAYERLIAERPVQASVAMYEVGYRSDHFICCLLTLSRGWVSGPCADSWEKIEKEPILCRRGLSTVENGFEHN